MPLTNLPNLNRALDLLAADNSLSLREHQALKQAIIKYPARFPLESFLPAERELAALSDSELYVFSTGGINQEEIQLRAPTATKFLTAAFDSIEWEEL